MSLTASLFSNNKTINVDLFGFEAVRQKVWGDEIMRALGCNLVYTLKDGDIYAFDESLRELKRELTVILSNKDTLINRGIWQDGLEFRIYNALEAIKVAEKHEDVGVWIG